MLHEPVRLQPAWPLPGPAKCRSNKRWDDASVSPVIRQTLLHWWACDALPCLLRGGVVAACGLWQQCLCPQTLQAALPQARFWMPNLEQNLAVLPVQGL